MKRKTPKKLDKRIKEMFNIDEISENNL